MTVACHVYIYILDFIMGAVAQLARFAFQLNAMLCKVENLDCSVLILNKQ